MDIDPRVSPYTRNNDPLPVTLKPILDTHLDAAKARISACNARIGEVKEGISNRLRRIKDLEMEVKDLQMELKQQTEARDGYNSAILRLVSTTSVVRQLPPEIIASVIGFSVGEGVIGFNERYLLDACGVSKLWRNTALSTPTLWKTLTVELDRFSNRRSHEQAKNIFKSTLDLWFSRGGEGAGVDLCLRLVEKEGPSLPPCNIIEWILASRFKFASLEFDDVDLGLPELRLLLSTQALSLHRTERLSLDLLPLRPPASQVIPTIDARSTLPKLDDLKLSGDDRIGLLPSLIIHPTLTKLHLYSVALPTGQLLEIMRGLPSLQFIVLFLCSILADEQATRPHVFKPLTHESIRDIILFDGILDFLNGLTCPTLQRLQLYSDSGDGLSTAGDLDDNVARALGNFLKRSRPLDLSLHLHAQFSRTSLNIVFAKSGNTIKTLHLIPSLFSLPLGVGVGDGDRRLALPRSIRWITCHQAVSEEESTAWMQMLAACLEHPSSQKLSVRFGKGKTAHVKHIN
ncbi:hypothetical protein BKA70DRAFT_1479535 [Coprinopsis sp. MPI-PUGE-AT-0042]|nr:hypothetical protein BKA70DRAFT_1479535 [Coprinopsis sp. MPI-PUGE-AT-0042]